MTIEYDNEELKAFILYKSACGKPYKKFLSNRKLLEDLDIAMIILDRVKSCHQLENSYKSLNYERLKHDRQGYSSVRLGNRTKYRLIFTEDEERITICLIEISEHYGDK